MNEYDEDDGYEPDFGSPKSYPQPINGFYHGEEMEAEFQRIEEGPPFDRAESNRWPNSLPSASTWAGHPTFESAATHFYSSGSMVSPLGFDDYATPYQFNYHQAFRRDSPVEEKVHPKPGRLHEPEQHGPSNTLVWASLLITLVGLALTVTLSIAQWGWPF